MTANKLDEPIRACAVPGCDKTAKKRGVCDMHYFRARGKPLDPKTIEAKKYVLAAHAGRRRPAEESPEDPESDAVMEIPQRNGPQRKWDDAEAAAMVGMKGPDAVDKAERSRARRATWIIAAVTEFATALDIGTMPRKDGRGHDDGWVYQNPSNKKAVHLDRQGQLHRAIVRDTGIIEICPGIG